MPRAIHRAPTRHGATPQHPCPLPAHPLENSRVRELVSICQGDHPGMGIEIPVLSGTSPWSPYLPVAQGNFSRESGHPHLPRTKETFDTYLLGWKS